MTRTHRRVCIAAAVLLALALFVFIGLQVAVRQLQSRIEGALGPRASIAGIRADWTGIDVLDLRVKAASGWPAEDELRAKRVRVVPDLRSLLTSRWRIASVTVEEGYLSALRTRDGKLHLVPALLEDRRAARGRSAPATPPSLEIGSVRLVNSTLALFDGSARQPPLALRLEALDADAGPVVLPDLDQMVGLKLSGVLKGPMRDGRVAIHGSLTPSSRDADLTARFSGVDIVGLQSYLLKPSEARVRQGALDLDLHATVVRNRLHAPGKVTLLNLELANEGPLATFAGVPKRAVLAAMTEKGRLEVRFTLDGRLDDPSFSLNEHLATKIASELAESLGVSLSNLVKGVGGVVKGLFGR